MGPFTQIFQCDRSRDRVSVRVGAIRRILSIASRQSVVRIVTKSPESAEVSPDELVASLDSTSTKSGIESLSSSRSKRASGVDEDKGKRGGESKRLSEARRAPDPTWCTTPRIRRSASRTKSAAVQELRGWDVRRGEGEWMREERCPDGRALSRDGFMPATDDLKNSAHGQHYPSELSTNTYELIHTRSTRSLSCGLLERKHSLKTSSRRDSPAAIVHRRIRASSSSETAPSADVSSRRRAGVRARVSKGRRGVPGRSATVSVGDPSTGASGKWRTWSPSK
ncbi:hypothetical protein B0H13DRAFT_1934327, partial [Mycena leptocephala]